MRAICCSLLVGLGALGACTTPGGPYPSLQPRAQEAIDPRLPVDRPINDRPVGAALASRLAQLVGDARSGDSSFQTAAAQAERLAAGAGAPQSEGWIAAQEALTAAIAAAGPTRAALSDIDAIGATALQTQGGIAPNDLAAIKSAAREVAAMESGQNRRIDSIKARLGD
jgi:hypothetical protein